ncbi:MAG: thioredoxin related protein, partial [Chthonomonadales bacterium]|nr:thioredoxin related protein [Chthonomonadales bacterium]
MRRTKMMWLSSLMLVSLMLPGIARADIDPEAEYAAIMARFQAAGKEAREKKTVPDFAAVQQEINLRVRADLKDIDPATIEPAKGLGWAQLFSLTGESQKMILAAQIFLNTNPDPPRKFAAQMLILNACLRSRDAVGIVKIVPTVAPPTVAQTLQLAHLLLDPTMIDTVAEKQGSTATFTFLKQVEAMVPFDQLKTTQELMYKESFIFRIADARADLFSAEGKQAAAVAVLEEAQKRISPDSYNGVAPDFQNKIAIAKLINSSALPLKRERGFGEFPGLGAYKGKIILLDFMDPSVSPCKESAPYLKQMYADLHSKGLEMVSVTSVHSPFAKPGATPETELTTMKAFLTKYELTWPVICVEEATLKNYAPFAIPR